MPSLEVRSASANMSSAFSREPNIFANSLPSPSKVVPNLYIFFRASSDAEDNLSMPSSHSFNVLFSSVFKIVILLFAIPSLTALTKSS